MKYFNKFAITVSLCLCLSIPAFGGGIDFSGDVGDVINFGDIPALDDATEVTLAAWIWQDNITQDHWIFGNWSAVGTFFFFDDVSAATTNTNVIRVFVQEFGPGGTADVESAENTGLADTWQHVAFTFIANTADPGIILYLDGVQVDTASTVGVLNAGQGNVPFRLGQRQDTSDNRNGKITEAYGWNKRLTADQIAQLAFSRIRGIGLQIEKANLQIHPDLHALPAGTSINGVTFKDLSGNGNDGTGTDADTDSLFAGEEVVSRPMLY